MSAIKKLFIGEAGYTFIELLTAIMILGLLVTPLLVMIVSGYSGLVMSGRQTVAVNLVRQRIEEIKAEGFDSYIETLSAQNGDSLVITEETIPGHSGFRRVTTLQQQYLPEGSDVRVINIAVRVIWVHQQGERFVEIESNLARR